MNIGTYLKINNKKIKKARKIGLIICLLMALCSSMILTFYHVTDILYQFELGYILLQLSILFFASIVACSIVFDKFVNY